MRSAKEAAAQCLALIHTADSHPVGSPEFEGMAHAVFDFSVAYIMELINDLGDQVKVRGIRQGSAVLGQARLTHQRWNAFLNRLTQAGHPWVSDTDQLFRVAIHKSFNIGPSLTGALWPDWQPPVAEGRRA